MGCQTIAVFQALIHSHLGAIWTSQSTLLFWEGWIKPENPNIQSVIYIINHHCTYPCYQVCSMLQSADTSHGENT